MRFIIRLRWTIKKRRSCIRRPRHITSSVRMLHRTSFQLILMHPVLETCGIQPRLWRKSWESSFPPRRPLFRQQRKRQCRIWKSNDSSNSPRFRFPRNESGHFSQTKHDRMEGKRCYLCFVLIDLFDHPSRFNLFNLFDNLCKRLQLTTQTVQ